MLDRVLKTPLLKAVFERFTTKVTEYVGLNSHNLNNSHNQVFTRNFLEMFSLNFSKKTSCAWLVGKYHRNNDDNELFFWGMVDWSQALRRLKFCSRRVGDPRWWGSLTMVTAGNKAKRLSPVNHTTKTIYHHHHYFLVW